MFIPDVGFAGEDFGAQGFDGAVVCAGVDVDVLAGEGGAGEEGVG